MLCFHRSSVMTLTQTRQIAGALGEKASHAIEHSPPDVERQAGLESTRWPRYWRMRRQHERGEKLEPHQSRGEWWCGYDVLL